jgi:hypothetical protein
LTRYRVLWAFCAFSAIGVYRVSAIARVTISYVLTFFTTRETLLTNGRVAEEVTL